MLCGGLLSLAVACHANSDTDTATWLSPEPAPQVSGLSVTRRQTFDLRRERGKVVVLSFGYTACLELCPDTFLKVRRLLEWLGPAAADVDFAYVTVDPERDQPAPFATFMASVDPRFQGIFLEGPALTDLLAAYHVTVRKRLPDPARYARRNVDPSAFYAMDHTAAFWLIDRRGNLRVRYRHDASEKELLAGARTLLAEKA
jgi:protein SCO1/2